MENTLAIIYQLKQLSNSFSNWKVWNCTKYYEIFQSGFHGREPYTCNGKIIVQPKCCIYYLNLGCP